MPKKFGFNPKSHRPGAGRFIEKSTAFVNAHGLKFRNARTRARVVLSEIQKTILSEVQYYKEIKDVAMGSGDIGATETFRVFSLRKGEQAQKNLDWILMAVPKGEMPYFLSEMRYRAKRKYEIMDFQRKNMKKKYTYGKAIMMHILEELISNIDLRLGKWQPEWPE